MISIYQIIHKGHGKSYIGKTKNSVTKRWSQHRSEAKHGGRRHLCESIHKYGANAFEVRLIDSASTDERASKLEKFYIKLFDTCLPNRGYNTTAGGGALCEDLARLKTRADVCNTELARLYEQGLSCTQIGKLFGMSWSPINIRLVNHGVRMRPRREQRGERRQDIPNEEIVRLYTQEEIGCDTIAKQFATNPATIGKRLRKLGIKMRPPGRQKQNSLRKRNPAFGRLPEASNSITL